MGLLVRPENMQRINTPELAKAYIDEQIADIKAQVGDKKVLLALSGGVDSSVVAALLIKAIGQQLVCVHVFLLRSKFVTIYSNESEYYVWYPCRYDWWNIGVDCECR